MPKILGQPLVDRQFAAHEPVGFGVAGAFEPALRKIAHEMATHFVDHGLRVLLFAGLRRFLGEPDIFPASAEVDEGGQEPGRGRAKDRVEGGAQEWLLDSTFEMKEDLDNAMNEPEEHRKSTGR